MGSLQHSHHFASPPRYSFNELSGKWTNPSPFNVKMPPSGSHHLEVRGLAGVASETGLKITAKAHANGFWSAGEQPALSNHCCVALSVPCHQRAHIVIDQIAPPLKSCV